MGKKRSRWSSSTSSRNENDASERHISKSAEATTAGQLSLKDGGLPLKNSTTDAEDVPKIRRHNPLLQGCRFVYDTYEQISRVSEGTYGIVWKGRDLATGDTVALKQIKFDVGEDKEGFPVIALREINVLMALSHESIVSVQEIVVGTAFHQVFMVMEFFDFDLKDGIERFEGALFQSELKGIMLQILSGMAHVHNSWYLHRDMKTSNILVHNSGRIALADFGLARQYTDPRRPLTQLVVTLWYRAPELLFGETHYGPPIDMWSIGCIFAELIRQDAPLKGEGELDQIDQIFTLLGVPNSDTWPLFDKLPNAGLLRWKPRKKEDIMLPKMFPVNSPLSTKQAFLDANGYNLLERLLTLDPAQRITAQEALDHAYLKEGVKPKTPRFFSTLD
ncbi:hypothetical protein ACA910_012606 [Epithemia clementina (nom. ined.)]